MTAAAQGGRHRLQVDGDAPGCDEDAGDTIVPCAFSVLGAAAAATLLLASCSEPGGRGPQPADGLDAAVEMPSQRITEPRLDAAQEDDKDSAVDNAAITCTEMLSRWEGYLAEPAMLGCTTASDCIVVGGQPATDPCNGHSTIGYCGKAANATAYPGSPAASLETAFAASCTGHVGYDCGLGRAFCSNGACTITIESFVGCFPNRGLDASIIFATDVSGEVRGERAGDKPAGEAGGSEAGGKEAGAESRSWAIGTAQRTQRTLLTS